jgi:hypothetical protein
MQILSDLDVVRFQVDVMSIGKFPMARRYVVKPMAYDITFSTEKIIEKGTIEMSGNASMEIDQQGANKSKDSDPKLDEEEAARASKKQKSFETDLPHESQGEKGIEIPAVVNETGTAVMPDKGMHIRDKDRLQIEKDKVLAHQLQGKENKEQLEGKGLYMGDAEEKTDKLMQVEQVEKTGARRNWMRSWWIMKKVRKNSRRMKMEKMI